MSCGSSYADVPRVVADRGQVAEDDIEAPRPDVRDVLQEEESGSNDANRVNDVGPDSRASASYANPVPRNADVLAGRPCGDHVDLADELRPVDLSDVAEVRSVRVPLGENGARAWRALRDVRDASVQKRGDCQAESSVAGTEFEDLQADPRTERRKCEVRVAVFSQVAPPGPSLRRTRTRTT